MKQKQLEQLYEEFGKIWASKINNFEINLLYRTIKLDLEIGGSDKTYQVIFEGVSSYYYIVGNKKAAVDVQPGYYSELTEIYYSPGEQLVLQQNIAHINKPYHHSYPNFWLEIWESVLLIEAKAFIINGKRYDVDS